MNKSYIEILKEKNLYKYYQTGRQMGVFQALPRQEKLFSQGYTGKKSKK